MDARSEQPTPGGHELVLRRVLNAPRELAFRVWSSPEHLARWWGPKDESGQPFSAPSIEMDFRPGGRYRICIRSPPGQEHWHPRTDRQLLRPARVAFTFAWEEDGKAQPPTLVEVSFEEQGPGKTLLTFRHSGLPSAASRDGHAGGWNGCLDRLVQEFDFNKEKS